MKLHPLFTQTRTLLMPLALGLLVTVAGAQPSTPMPADIVKPIPKAGMEMKPGMEVKPNMDMKPGMDMKQGMNVDMKPMMTDMHNQMMGMKTSGNADVDFAMMMRMHHQGAITMAEAQLANGKDAQMRSMAKNIIRDQKKEIAVFDKFLAKRGESGMKMGSPGMQMNK